MRRGGGTRVAGLIGAMVLALFMVVMDNSILNVALPYLSSPEGGLGAGVDELQWVINAYVLSFGAFIFVWAVIGGRLGQRRAILAATALFGVFSMLAGLSTSPLVLIILRALMGVAAAGMQPTSLSIINTGVPESLRARAIGLWSAAAGLAVVSGPIFGGLLLEHLGWRSIFFINVPLSCLLLALTIVFVPRSLDAESPRASVRSVVLLMAGMFLLVYGITEWGDNPDQPVLPALLVGVGVLLCLVFFLLQEMSASPVMPVSMVFGKRTAGASVSLALAMMLLMGNVFVMMLYLRLVRGYDALTVAYTLLPVGIAQLLISPVASSSIKRIHPRVTVLVGFALTALAFLGYSRFDERTAMWLILVVFFVHGAGADPHLEGAVGQGPQGGVPLRVPLHAHRAGGLERRPLPVIGVKPRIEAARAGPAQGLLEARPAHPHRQDPLLAGLGGPPAAVHHPQEGRLDPGHPAAAEGRHESTGGHRGSGDGRSVGLVDGDGLLIPHGPHLTTRTERGRGPGLLTHGPQPATPANPRPSGPADARHSDPRPSKTTRHSAQSPPRSPQDSR